MDGLECQARLDALGLCSTPAAQQIIGAEAQVLGAQEPNAHHGSGDLVGQQLAHIAFEAGRIAWLEADFLAGALCLKKNGLIAGAERREFFFEGRRE